jgi:hypothetical protein
LVEKLKTENSIPFYLRKSLKYYIQGIFNLPDHLLAGVTRSPDVAPKVFNHSSKADAQGVFLFACRG